MTDYKKGLAMLCKQLIACSRRSDSGACSSPVSPRFFPALSLAFFFARALPSERLEQAKQFKENSSILAKINKTGTVAR